MWRYEPANEDNYLGNIWGWRFSFFGAALIGFLILLAIGVSLYRGVPLVEGSSPSNSPTATAVGRD